MTVVDVLDDVDDVEDVDVAGNSVVNDVFKILVKLEVEVDEDVEGVESVVGIDKDVVGNAGVGECVGAGIEGEPVSETILAALVSEVGMGILAGRVDLVVTTVGVDAVI